MVNQEIYHGIKAAIAKGETLQKAMFSFYNAGYGKSEIEEAARAVQLEQFQEKYNSNNSQNPQKNSNSQIITKQSLQPIKKTPENTKINSQLEGQDLERLKQLTQQISSQSNQPQKISNYDSIKPESNNGKNILLISLSIIFILLLGGLFLSILFKESIIEFLNKL